MCVSLASRTSVSPFPSTIQELVAHVADTHRNMEARRVAVCEQQLNNDATAEIIRQLRADLERATLQRLMAQPTGSDLLDGRREHQLRSDQSLAMVFVLVDGVYRVGVSWMDRGAQCVPTPTERRWH